MTTRGPMLFVVVARPRKGGGEMDLESGGLACCGGTVKIIHYLMPSLLCFNDRAAWALSGSVQVVITALL